MNLRKQTQLAYFIILSAFCPAPVHAWTLIDDFESYNAETVYSIANDNAIYPVINNNSLGAMQIFRDIGGVGGHQAAWFWYYQAVAAPGYECAAGAGDSWHHIPLPQKVGINGQASVFFRIYLTGYDSAWNAMLSKYSANEIPDCTPDWGYMASILRFRSDLEPPQVDARDGDGYIFSDPDFMPAIETWYSYWIYVDNSFDESDPDNPTQEDVGYYQVFVMGPGDAAPRLLSWQSGDDIVSKLAFRNTDYTSIKDLVFYQGLSSEPDVWLIDDIYFTMGKDLSDPVPTWCGFPESDGYADTGGWLGWLWTGAAPWMYSMSLNSWVYVPGCPDGAGGWVYVGM